MMTRALLDPAEEAVARVMNTTLTVTLLDIRGARRNEPIAGPITAPSVEVSRPPGGGIRIDLGRDFDCAIPACTDGVRVVYGSPASGPLYVHDINESFLRGGRLRIARVLDLAFDRDRYLELSDLERVIILQGSGTS